MKLVLFLLWFAASDSASARHTYHVIMRQMVWADAQTYCRSVYSDLATIVSNNDWMRLRKEKRTNNLNSSVWVWVGLYNDIESWHWSLDNVPNTAIKKWAMNEPDNNGGNQACVMIDSDAKWYDETCADPKPFICYTASGSDADRFVGVSSPVLSWTDAQTHCRTFHTDLASALSRSDNNLLGQVASVQGSSWIGLFRDTWKFSDGTVPAKLDWASGQPDNSGLDENCAAVTNGDFTDELCDERYYFICHSFPKTTEKKIMRLNVKSDGSVLDPGVQALVLEQIRQKLVEHGLDETSVTWRVQSDGNIFHKKKKKEL